MTAHTEKNEKAVQLGAAIVTERNKRGWSQVRLAEEAKVKPTTLSNIELGKIRKRPNPDTLAKILAALDMQRRYYFELMGYPIDDVPNEESRDTSLLTILEAREDLKDAVRLAGTLPADNDTVAVAISLIRQAVRGEAIRRRPRRRRHPPEPE